MAWLIRAVHSSIGAKLLVAVTGLAMMGFVVGHLSGNLLIFKGPEAINTYAKMLHDLGPLLWVARVGLLGTIALHIYLTIYLRNKNVAARPVAYATKRYNAAPLTSRWMAASGMLVVSFITYHLLHFTMGVTNPATHATNNLINETAYGPVGHPDVYAMVIAGFSNPLIAGVYALAVTLLGLHLAHGASSVFQTLGVTHPNYNGLIRAFGPAFGALVTAGYVSIPAAVLLGLVR